MTCGSRPEAVWACVQVTVGHKAGRVPERTESNQWGGTGREVGRRGESCQQHLCGQRTAWLVEVKLNGQQDGGYDTRELAREHRGRGIVGGQAEDGGGGATR